MLRILDLARVLCLTLVWVSGSAWAQVVAIQDVRVWAGPDGTRLVFDLSGPVRYQVESLSEPDRVALDINNAKLASTPALTTQGFFKELRAAPQSAQTLRVVVELTQAASPNVFAVDPSGSRGHRLVVDLKPGKPAVAKAAPVATMAAAPAPVRTLSSDQSGARDIVVAIDAGHGGVDPGAIGRKGVREKDVTLAIARRLRDRLNREPGITAVLTRDTDVFLPLRDRIGRAQAKQADIFVSVHADAVTNRDVAGSSVYVLSARGASDEAARLLADRENAADLVGGVNLEHRDPVLRSVLLDLSQGASMSASIEAAHNVLRELDRVGNVRRPQVQHAGFVVLKSPNIPSMLIETAFISNPDEEKKLSNPSHQQKLAEAISNGVLAYFNDNPPPGTRLALRKARSERLAAGSLSGTSGAAD